MKFRSPDEIPRRVTSGIGIWLIGRDWVSIPSHAQPSAYAAGCISQAMTNTSAGKQAQTAMVEGMSIASAEKAKIKEFIMTWYKDTNEYAKKFKKDNTPSLTALGNAMGHTVNSGYARAMGAEVRKELGIPKGELTAPTDK